MAGCSKGEIDSMTDGILNMMGVFVEMECKKSDMANAVARGKVIDNFVIYTDMNKYMPTYLSRTFHLIAF